MDIQIIWHFLLETLAYGGTGGALAYALAKWLGAKWIDDRLARGLEVLRAEQAKDLARAKANWDADLQGLLKYQEREFLAVGEAWRLLQLASTATYRAASPFSLPFDLHSMGDHQLKHFLEATFSDQQVRTITTAPNQAAALEALFAVKLRAECEARLADFSVHVNASFPFIPEALFEKLDQAHVAMSKMMSNLRMEGVIPGHGGRYASMEVGNVELHPLLEDVRGEVRAYMAGVRSRLGMKP